MFELQYFRTQEQFRRAESWIIILCILIFSVLVNFNRFFEYETKVRKNAWYVRIYLQLIWSKKDVTYTIKKAKLFNWILEIWCHFPWQSWCEWCNNYWKKPKHLRNHLGVEHGASNKLKKVTHLFKGNIEHTQRVEKKYKILFEQWTVGSL